MPEETITRLILKDGTVLNNCECGYYNRSLWCYLKGYSFSEAFQLFSDPDNFETVIFEYGTKDYYKRISYSGFESITAVEQRELTVDVRLEGNEIIIHEDMIAQEDQNNEED